MLKIWFINHFAMKPEYPGGSRHFDFAMELVKRGHKVTIFASDFSCMLRKYYGVRCGELYSSENYKGVDYYWVKTISYQNNDWLRVLNMLSFSFNLLRVGRKLERPDIILGSSPHLFAALAGYLLSIFKKTKFVLEIRDLWPQVIIEMGKDGGNRIAIKALKIIENLLYKKADRIVVLSKGLMQYLKERGVPEEKITFVPNGVHFDYFSPSLSREQAREKYHFNKFTLVYTGAHGPANALETILKAAMKLENNNAIEFVLLGDGPEKSKLKNIILGEKINNVRLLDSIPKKEVPDFLLAADGGVITLKNIHLFKYGVSPNKLFDYMASALPVISCIGGDMGEVVKEAGAGFNIPPEDGAALAEAAVKLMNSSELERKNMGINGLNYVSKYYSREKQINIMEEMFKEIDVLK